MVARRELFAFTLLFFFYFACHLLKASRSRNVELVAWLYWLKNLFFITKRARVLVTLYYSALDKASVTKIQPHVVKPNFKNVVNYNGYTLQFSKEGGLGQC